MQKKSQQKLEPHHPQIRKNASWYKMSIEHILESLNATRKGLSAQEVEKRQEKYGKNELPKAKRLSGFTIFINQFKSPLVYILLIAAAIAALFAVFHEDTDFIDSIVIISAVMINVIISFFQERKAERALKALQEIVVTHTNILREGELKRIEIGELVPGDIVHLNAGDKVPADCRLMNTTDLMVDEAALTGESKVVEKQTQAIHEDRIVAERENMVFMGTIIASGTGEAVVVSTGVDTQIGHIAQLVLEHDQDTTPLQKKLTEFSKKLSLAISGIALFIFILGLFTRSLTLENTIVMFETAIAVAVAAIPEGLVIAVTIVLAVGMQRILEKKALVRQLLAAETLGSTTVICTDKTGTITEGKMHVVQIATEENMLEEFNHKNPEISKEGAEEFVLLLRIGTLCNDAFIENQKEDLGDSVFRGSPTETALLMAASGVGLNKEKLEKETPRIDTIPFDSSQKFMATLHTFAKKENILYLKGAPERVLDFCGHVYTHTGKKEHKKMTREVKEKIEKQYETMSRSGLRVLAVAYRKVDTSFKKIADVQDFEDEFIFVGFVGIKDPLRKTAKETLELCKQAGIHVVMITGDHRLTARAIGFELGLDVDPKNVLVGEDLKDMTETELKKRVRDITVYARVSPEDKLRIVKAWKSHGEVVAMTGDGVNDAPAIKKADIGIALGSGTEVAKETAELVLLNNDFSTIVTAIKEGRVIYDNIKKIVLYLLADSFTQVFLIIAALILGWPLPILVAQILYINLITDTLPALALTQDPAGKNIMQESPRERDLSILDGRSKGIIGVVSVVTALVATVIFVWSWKSTGDLDRARTLAFTSMAFGTLFYVFSIRSLTQPVWKINITNNKYLIGAIITGIIMQLLAIYLPFLKKFLKTVPMYPNEWIIVGLGCVVVIIMIELIKWIYNSKLKVKSMHRTK